MMNPFLCRNTLAVALGALSLSAAASPLHNEMFHADQSALKAQVLDARPLRSEEEVIAMLTAKINREQARQYRPDEVRAMLVVAPETMQLMRRGLDPSLVSIRISDGKVRKEGSAQSPAGAAPSASAPAHKSPLQLNGHAEEPKR